VLLLLYQVEGSVVTREEIIQEVWPEADPAGVSESALNGLIKRLRQRLRETPIQALGKEGALEYLEVLRGHGLRLSQPGD